jgi:hypothetical protein
MKKIGLLFIVAILLVNPFSVNIRAAQPQVREIAVYTLPDIAMASYDQYGPVIYYNPQAVEQAGPLVAAFFWAHEYGHINLDHMRREMFVANPYNHTWVRRSHEVEADCYAARYWAERDPRVIEAALWFFQNAIGSAQDRDHPTGYERAQYIRQCLGIQ